MRRTLPNIADSKDGGRGPWAKNCGQPQKAGKSKEMDSPLEPPERNVALLPS